MKTNFITKFLVAVMSGSLMLVTVACNSGGGGGGNNNTYTMSNGQCYLNGQIQPITSCGNYTQGLSGYSLVSGQCVQTSNNQPVSPQYCTYGSQTSTISGYPYGMYPSSGITAGICSGVFYYAVTYGYFQPVWCDAPYIDNCAGYTLINNYGQFEYCM